MSRFIPNGKTFILDIATGTGDVLSSVMNKRNIGVGVGLDMADNMLLLAKKKLARRHNNVYFVRANAMKLPFKNESVDIITMAFGIRNMPDPICALMEAYRVLKKCGRIVILEFSMPDNLAVRCMYLFYLRRILPLTGRLISKDPYAYRYLNKTIEAFPYGDEFLYIMNKAGFANLSFYPQTFGICTIYVGEKSEVKECLN